MSGVQAYATNQLATQIQQTLTAALTSFLGANNAAQFASVYAPPTAAQITDSSFVLLRKLVVTSFMVGIGLAVLLISITILFPILARQPKSVHKWLLFSAHFFGIIAFSVCAAIINIEEIAIAYTATVPPFLITMSTGSVLFAALWQTAELWSKGIQRAYRLFISDWWW